MNKRKHREIRLPQWLSVFLRPADDPMGLFAVGTFMIAIGWVSFRLWKRLRRRAGRAR